MNPFRSFRLVRIQLHDSLASVCFGEFGPNPVGHGSPLSFSSGDAMQCCNHFIRLVAGCYLSDDFRNFIECRFTADWMIAHFFTFYSPPPGVYQEETGE